MAELKDKIRADLSAAMKDRDSALTGALRMALSAIGTEEVAGKEARELSDEEVQRVLTKEAKKREESAAAFDQAGRQERAREERAEAEVLRGYLPAQLEDDELDELVRRTISEVAEQLGEQPGMKQMGQVMKAVNGKVAGRAEGGRVSGLVKAHLNG